MRFFFECVTCFTTVTNTSSSEETSSHTTPTAEETRSLVTSSPTLSNQRRRKRAPTRGSSADWKPSLFAISEDNAISATPQKPVNRKQVTPVASPRNVKRCGPSSVQVNARSRSHDFGRDPLPMVFPTFPAFMF